MALPNACSWKAIREELKRCFSDQTSLGHAATQLENMTQKPNEPLRLYIFRYSKIHKSVTKEMPVMILILQGGLDSEPVSLIPP